MPKYSMFNLNADVLRGIAANLGHCAQRYQQIADLLQQNQIGTLPVRNWEGLQKGLGLISGHVAAAQKAVDDWVIAAVRQPNASRHDPPADPRTARAIDELTGHGEGGGAREEVPRRRAKSNH